MVTDIDTETTEKNVGAIQHVALVCFRCLEFANNRAEFNDVICGASIALKENPQVTKTAILTFSALASIISSCEFQSDGGKVNES